MRHRSRPRSSRRTPRSAVQRSVFAFRSPSADRHGGAGSRAASAVADRRERAPLSEQSGFHTEQAQGDDYHTPDAPEGCEEVRGSIHEWDDLGPRGNVLTSIRGGCVVVASPAGQRYGADAVRPRARRACDRGRRPRGYRREDGRPAYNATIAMPSATGRSARGAAAKVRRQGGLVVVAMLQSR